MPLIYMNESQRKMWIFVGGGVIILILGGVLYSHYRESQLNTPQKIQASEFSKVDENQLIVIEGYISSAGSDYFISSDSSSAKVLVAVRYEDAGFAKAIVDAEGRPRRVRVEGVRIGETIDSSTFHQLKIKDAATDKSLLNP